MRVHARPAAPVLAAVTALLAHRASPPSAASLRRPPTAAAAPARFVAAMATGGLNYPRPTVVEAPRAPATAVIFMLHGLGDTADGWLDVATMLRGTVPHAKWILPTAPTRPITLNGGMPMPGWYDIASLDSIAGREDREGLAETTRYLASLIDAEVAAGVPRSRIVVAGFSQGAASALMQLRGEGAPLAGVVALSGYLPLARDGPVSPANAATPVLMCHGDADAVVAYKFGVDSAAALKAAGAASVEFKTYRGMGHAACNDELSDVADFLTARLPPQ